MGFLNRLTDAFGSDKPSANLADLGGAQWDGAKWTVDGVPVTYRVTWKTYDGEDHEREFTDIDQGYSFYEDMQKGASAYRVTWEHVPH
ncbi:hypothetical protein AZH51_16065 [Branchiibius sp. NY16-3462-2]|nr:hypothetical protein AZH51_16065 [Branchiibius sp. NY16-3462-2]